MDYDYIIVGSGFGGKGPRTVIWKLFDMVKAPIHGNLFIPPIQHQKTYW